MAMTIVWVLMTGISILWGTATGRAAAVSASAMEGAQAAFSLVLAIGGPLCLWSGVMEVMRRSGLAGLLADRLRPLLGKLFPSAKRDPALMEALSCNLSANLLGLGNAATPAGIRAAERLHTHNGNEPADNELCRLVVMNTASVQLLPTTVAAVRAANGAVNSFDILPAVWLSSLFSVAVGLCCAALFGRSRS